MHTHARGSRASETTEDRHARLERDKIRSASRGHTECPVFGNDRVKQKVVAFHSKLNEVKFASCDTCLESFPGLSIKVSENQCVRCSRDKKTPKLYSADNNIDPGPVSQELQGLSQVEEMLISAVMPIMTVYRLPHGQLGYNGHVVNLPQDVRAFVATLPRHVHELDVLVVRREGIPRPGVHKDFKVRRVRVLSALRWLKANNVHYRNITISDSAIQQLPEDGDVTTLPSVDLQESSSDCTENASTSDDPYNEHLSQTFVPMHTRSGTEKEVLTQGIANRQNPAQSSRQQPLSWPQITDTPINELTTQGYMTCLSCSVSHWCR